MSCSTFFSVLAVLVAAMGYAAWPTLTYYYNIGGLLMQGEGMYASYYVDGERAPLNLFNASVYTTTKEGKARMKEYSEDAPGLGSGNFLGAFVLNDAVMSRGTIALGADKETHDKMRPIFDRFLWGKDKVWKEADVVADVKEFLDGKTEVNVRDDLTAMVVKILFNRWLGADFESKDVADFLSYQGSRLMVSILPKPVTRVMSSTVSDLNKQHESLLDKILTSVRAQQGGPFEFDSEYAWGALDALTFAGGLGVPTLLHHCVAVLANGEAEEVLEKGEGGSIKMDVEKLDLLIMETSRLYPAVSEVPFTRNGDREVIALGTMFQEKAVWGEDADRFKLRPMSLYHDNLAAFAEWAPNRMCPGKGLALAIIKAFLTEINQRGWTVEDGGSIKSAGYDFPAFTIKLS